MKKSTHYPNSVDCADLPTLEAKKRVVSGEKTGARVRPYALFYDVRGRRCDFRGLPSSVISTPSSRFHASGGRQAPRPASVPVPGRTRKLRAFDSRVARKGNGGWGGGSKLSMLCVCPVGETSVLSEIALALADPTLRTSPLRLKRGNAPSARDIALSARVTVTSTMIGERVTASS